MTYRAVIFDLDGTLLDTLADIGRAANEVLARLDFPTHPLDAYRYFVGDGVGMLFTKALPAGAVREDVLARCGAEFREAYGRGWNVETRVYDGVPELLDELANRGRKLAVLSNKPDSFTKDCVRHYLSAWRFEAVLGQREGVPRKPDPAAAGEILNQLATPAEQVLYLGDTAVDMQTARAAGVYPVGALWGFRPAEELVEAGAEVLIEHPLQLLDLIG
jgi:phosphoglycolate phosphatase